jgi:NAD(P)-dependent dehydrogenase (short-subunit alcohol dehydrogenase family)
LKGLFLQLQTLWKLIWHHSLFVIGKAVLTQPSPAFFYPQESPEAVAYHKSNALEGRLTDVKDIAPVVKFLCTEGQWITGQTIFANGGYTTR